MDDWKTIRSWSRDEMMKRVARFRMLRGSDGGLPDSKLPECRRKLYAVIGFQPPMSDNAATTSPVGANASQMPAISISEGFNLGYCKAKPGKGPLMHLVSADRERSRVAERLQHFCGSLVAPGAVLGERHAQVAA